jgi:hypothetical protein
MPGAEVVKQLVPAVELRYFDGGHFVLDEFADAIAEPIIETFSPVRTGAARQSSAPRQPEQECPRFRTCRSSDRPF